MPVILVSKDPLIVTHFKLCQVSDKSRGPTYAAFRIDTPFSAIMKDKLHLIPGQHNLFAYFPYIL